MTPRRHTAYRYIFADAFLPFLDVEKETYIVTVSSLSLPHQNSTTSNSSKKKIQAIIVKSQYRVRVSELARVYLQL